MKKFFITAVTVVMAAVGLSACTDANVASQNLSQDADNFRIVRKVTFINGITDSVLLEVVGRCSIKADAADSQLEVVCKIEDGSFVKHFLGVSDNVTYTVEQLVGADVSTSFYRFTIKPSVIIPNIEIR